MADVALRQEPLDLASERLGGSIIHVSDEFFAPAENLLKPGRGVFVEDKYTENGKWMDGWESRRRRTPGHDWCVTRLGAPGAIKSLVIDTNHFRGNHPEAASVEACFLDHDPSLEELAEVRWTEISPKTKLNGHAENLITVKNAHPFTHVRLNIYPDGGVARLRVIGEVRPDWVALSESGKAIDLVSAQHGGRALAASDRFFSDPMNLLMPGRAENMGDGWETRRRRGEGYDWVILELGKRGVIEMVEVDTNHFKGNYPDRCRIEACLATSNSVGDLMESGTAWKDLVPMTKLGPDRQHLFEKEVAADIGPVSHVRLCIHPDGGVSRLRLWGHVS